jgi:hypothetical protein
MKRLDIGGWFACLLKFLKKNHLGDENPRKLQRVEGHTINESTSAVSFFN